MQNDTEEHDIEGDAPFDLGSSKELAQAAEFNCSSALLIASDSKHHFERRYNVWLQQQLPRELKHNAAPGKTTNLLSGADAAALVSLIAAPEPLNDATRITAHQTAVDHACVALKDLMLRDKSGAAATKVIQGGALQYSLHQSSPTWMVATLDQSKP